MMNTKGLPWVKSLCRAVSLCTPKAAASTLIATCHRLGDLRFDPVGPLTFTLYVSLAALVVGCALARFLFVQFRGKCLGTFGVQETER